MDVTKLLLLTLSIFITLSHNVLGKKLMESSSLEFVSSFSGNRSFDSVVIIGESWKTGYYSEIFEPYLQAIKEFSERDASVSSDVTVFLLANQSSKLPRWAVWSPTGPVTRDYDDVRCYKEAAFKGMERALKAGKRRPLLAIYNDNKPRKSQMYNSATIVALLGAVEAVYVPIEVRELPSYQRKVESIGFSSTEIYKKNKVPKLIRAIEHARIIARDISGSDPERMTPINVEKYMREAFTNSSIKMEVTSGYGHLVKKYPLFAAVERCANEVPRHRGRIIYLEYSGKYVKNTYMFVGKGVTFDTGGANIKIGGNMNGMHTDKTGAAVVAGLFKMLDILRPYGVKVVARLAMVRNSVGANSYIPGEIITSAAGVRVRVGNTDAEGRMAMADPLHYTKIQALKEINPHIFTVATLTGHAILSMGREYTVLMDNGPAKKAGFAYKMQEIGDEMASPFEVTNLRREDYNKIDGRYGYEDIIQALVASSSRTPRGHQYAMAFLIRASGLDKHGCDSAKPLKYSHFDIAGSGTIYPGIPTADPIPAFAKLLIARR